MCYLRPADYSVRHDGLACILGFDTFLVACFNPNRSLDFTSFCFYLRCIATISSKA